MRVQLSMLKPWVPHLLMRGPARAVRPQAFAAYAPKKPTLPPSPARPAARSWRRWVYDTCQAYAVLPGVRRERCPIAGEQGQWAGERCQSGWLSSNPQVIKITGLGVPVIYRNRFPDFTPWAVAVLTFPPGVLTGEAADMRAADRAYAAHSGQSEAAARKYRKIAAFVWHHCEDGQTMQLLPMALHMNVPHSGGASLLRQLRQASCSTR